MRLRITCAGCAGTRTMPMPDLAPAGAVEMRLNMCDRCADGTRRLEAEYVDAEGRRLDFRGNLLTRH